jgi:cell division protein FtsI/penicillin-binding protein 2
MKFSKLTRVRQLAIIFLAAGALVIIQMFRLQTSANAEALIKWKQGVITTTKTLVPERGRIYDRWGHLLAGSKEVYEVGIYPQYVKNQETLATTLATVLDIDLDKARGIASTPFMVDGKVKHVYYVVTSSVSEEKIAELDKLKTQYEDANPGGDNPELPSLRGLTWLPYMQRFYPEGSTAANILGYYTFLNREKPEAHGGVEEKYNQQLTGNAREVDIRVNPLEVEELPTIPPGTSLILTIDREIQKMAETQLDLALQHSGAVNGTIIIENPRNGEILAMAVTPRMNLNEYWNMANIFGEGDTPNKAVDETYEPGSVFKVLTMAAALDAGVVTPETNFYDTGTLSYGGITVYNWNRGAWGNQDMTGCMRHSLNVCLAWISTSKLEATKFYEYMLAFGIGRKANIDLAGEEYFPLAVPGDKYWAPAQLATNAFGQGVSVSPVQMVMAVSSIANNGKMIAPHVLKAYVQDGQQYNINPIVVSQPVSKKTALTLTSMLAVSLEEESSDALVDGYRVAGKTGTAEVVVDGAYSSNLTNASFVGWGPADDPQFLVYVWLEKPTASPWGSVVASPVFRDVVKDLVILLDIPPDEQRLQLKK